VRRRAAPICVVALGSCVFVIGAVSVSGLGEWPWYRAAILHVDNPHIRLPPSEGAKGRPHATFLIRNIGTAPLVIERVSSSCGCAVVKAPEDTIPPNGESQIEVAAVRPPLGTATVTLTIKSNCRRSPNRTLKVTGFGEKEVPYIVSKAERLVLVRPKQGDGLTQLFWIRTMESEYEESWLRTFECSIPFIQIATTSTTTKKLTSGNVDRVYSMSATIIDSSPAPGHYRGIVTSRECQELSIPVVCRVSPHFVPSPSVLFASLAIGEEAQFLVVVHSTYSGYHIAKVESLLPNVFVEHYEVVENGYAFTD